jgi:hypothetical protein
MRKTAWLLILGGLLLAISGCGNSSSHTSNTTPSTTSTTISTQLKEPIEKYFNEYFNSQKTLQFTRMDNNILENNDNTNLNETFREIEIEAQNRFNTGFNDYQYQIQYKNLTMNGDVANVDLSLNLDFHYKNARGIDSGIYGVNYRITMKNDGTRWVITQIDSDLQEFQTFKQDVQARMAKNTVVKQSDILDQIKQEKLRDIQMMSNNSLYLKGAPSTLPSGDDTDVSNGSNTNASSGSVTTQSVYVSCKAYAYSPTSATNYALYYAKADTNSRLFFTARNNYGGEVDCTNFVSQCIWAGYVGFDQNNLAKAKSNRDNKIGMVYSDWHAGIGGSTTIWQNVDELWNYLTKTKEAGPNAIGYNNGKPYTSMAARDIQVGNLLQLRSGGGTDYHHSVFVTGKPDGADQYSQILISSHTNNRKNLSLFPFVIDSFGGSNCYMRRAVMQTSNMKK